MRAKMAYHRIFLRVLPAMLMVTIICSGPLLSKNHKRARFKSKFKKDIL